MAPSQPVLDHISMFLILSIFYAKTKQYIRAKLSEKTYRRKHSLIDNNWNVRRVDRVRVSSAKWFCIAWIHELAAISICSCLFFEHSVLVSSSFFYHLQFSVHNFSYFILHSKDPVSFRWFSSLSYLPQFSVYIMASLTRWKVFKKNKTASKRYSNWFL